MPNITSNFRIEEFACRCGCGGERAPEIAANLARLALMLEHLRSALGNKPITVTCAYRCPKHNAKIGGEKASFHLKGLAADIQVAGLTPQQVQAVAAKLLEIGGLGCYERFSHVDVRPRVNGRQALWVGAR